MSRKKVTVVGGGFVGSTTAQRIVDLELADVVLTDILDGPPAGKALDMLESGPITRTDSRATGASTASGDYSATGGSDIVVITAGFPRKPGMSRDDLLKANYDVVKAVVEQVVKHSPDCVIIVVTNPLDAMAQAAFKVSGFPKNRVLGMAGVLDSARMSSFVAAECKVSVENVHSFVLGGHGDDMVPLPRYSTVAGIPLPDLLPKERIDAIVERTRKGRCGDRQSVEDRLGLLCAVGGSSGNGGSHFEGQEEDFALRCVLGWRVWDQGALRRRPGETGRRRS
jgi:malate dehydrogenase